MCTNVNYKSIEDLVILNKMKL